MKHTYLSALAALTLLPCTLSAQTHRVARSQSVVRAVGVYEWTGDLAKPLASRLIPVTLFLDGHFQDAGEYMARPIPLALEPGNLYELQTAGVSHGTLELSYARHLQPTPEAAASSTPFDDGWFGYGVYRALAAEKKVAALRRIDNPRITSSKPTDPDRPHFSSKGSAPSAPAGQGSGSTAASDSDPAAAERRAAELGPNADKSSAPTRPVTKSAPAANSTKSSDPLNDPDRPSLQRHTADEQKKASRAREDSSVKDIKGSLNDDPNRPSLHRGRSTSSMGERDLPRLAGLPADLHQMAAVSDAQTREEHDFTRAWREDSERATVLAKLQALARAQLAAYGPAPSASVSLTPAGPPRLTRNHPPAHTAGRTRPHAASASAPAPEPLLDEHLNGYTLSYGATPTYAYSGHTSGEGAAVRYVSVVAQGDLDPSDPASLRLVLASTTDAQHLDRSPWMRLIDAVDAEASNRASLLFELRGQTARQFALYRVIAAKAEQTYLSGTTP